MLSTDYYYRHLLADLEFKKKNVPIIYLGLGDLKYFHFHKLISYLQ